MSPADVLRKAADVIRERGWCQRTYTDGSAVCAYGAINVACGGKPSSRDFIGDSPSFREEAIWILRRLTPSHDISGWNDAPERTAEEVIAALEKAAELAEAKVIGE